MHTTEPLDVPPLRAIARAFALALLVLFVLLLEYAATRPRPRRWRLPRRIDLPIMATRSLRLSSKGASR
jgi:hypothetical protein